MNRILTGLLAFIVVALIAGQVFLPVFAKNLINKKLNEIQGYRGHVESVSVFLPAAELSLHQIDIEKIQAKGTKPVINIQTAKILVNWSDLFKAKFDTTIILESPQLHFIAETPAPAKGTELSPQEAWRLSMRQLLPLHINTIVLHNGHLHYQNRIDKPEFDATLHNIEMNVSGLQQKPTATDLLPAHLSLTAKAFNQADFELNLHFNPYATTPTFKLEAQMENLQLNQIDDFLKHYTKLQAKAGTFSFYLEAAASNGKITGYIKPFMQGLKVQTPPEDQANILKKAYKGVVQAANAVLKNGDTKNVATQIDIGGNINDPDASLWSVISSLLQNAFLEALLPGVDHSIEFKSLKA